MAAEASRMSKLWLWLEMVASLSIQSIIAQIKVALMANVYVKCRSFKTAFWLWRVVAPDEA